MNHNVDTTYSDHMISHKKAIVPLSIISYVVSAWREPFSSVPCKLPLQPRATVAMHSYYVYIKLIVGEGVHIVGLNSYAIPYTLGSTWSVTIEWDPPSQGGSPLNYTITTTPVLISGLPPDPVTTSTITTNYNTDYTITITALSSLLFIRKHNYSQLQEMVLKYKNIQTLRSRWTWNIWFRWCWVPP